MPRLMPILLACVCGFAQARDLSEIYERVRASVVVVHTAEDAQQMLDGTLRVPSQGMGSGVVIDREGRILTSAHIAAFASSVLVEFVGGERIPAQVLGTSNNADVALLRLNRVPAGLVPAPLGDSDAARIGSEVFVVGAPHGLSQTLTAGHLSGRRREASKAAQLFDFEFLQTDAAINQGNSGGPLFSEDGKVIGIVSHFLSQSGGSTGLGFAASINMTRRLLLTGRPVWLGIDWLPVRGELAKALNLADGEGVLVQRVARGSHGDALGLQGGNLPVSIGDFRLLLGGDIIVEVGGIPVGFAPEQLRRLVDLVQSQSAGSQTEVVVLRDGRRVRLSAIVR